MNKVFFLIVTLLSSVSFACTLGSQSLWNLSEAQLEKVTKIILIARLQEVMDMPSDLQKKDLKFQVLKVQKGNYTSNSFTLEKIRLAHGKSVSYGTDCGMQFNYRQFKVYRIFVDTLNPHSIQSVDEGTF